MMRFAFTIFIALLSFSACEVIDDPIPANAEDNLQIGAIGADSARLFDSLGIFADTDYKIDQALNLDDTDSLISFILNNTWAISTAPDNSNRRFITLEEFTGHECIFCPLGTKEIIRLDTIFKEQLVPIAIHAGGFARPRQSGDKFTTDFRVEGGHGELYQQEFNPGNAYPRGMVSRLRSTGNAGWEADINSIAADSPIAELKLTSYYSNNANVVRAQIQVIPLVPSSESFSLQVFLKEDNIVDWQKDAFSNPVDIEFYNHRHTLRKVVNGTWGLNLPNWQVGDTLSYQYVTTVDPNWKPQDLEVVCFIFDNDQSSYEVMQANAAYFTPR